VHSSLGSEEFVDYYVTPEQVRLYVTNELSTSFLCFRLVRRNGRPVSRVSCILPTNRAVYVSSSQSNSERSAHANRSLIPRTYTMSTDETQRRQRVQCGIHCTCSYVFVLTSKFVIALCVSSKRFHVGPNCWTFKAVRGLSFTSGEIRPVTAFTPAQHIVSRATVTTGRLSLIGTTKVGTVFSLTVRNDKQSSTLFEIAPLRANKKI